MAVSTRLHSSAAVLGIFLRSILGTTEDRFAAVLADTRTPICRSICFYATSIREESKRTGSAHSRAEATNTTEIAARSIARPFKREAAPSTVDFCDSHRDRSRG